MPIAHVNGTAIHYHVKGTGVPIIMIHPPLINSAIFRYQQVQLSDEFKIVTFDVRGHGYSAHSDREVTYPLIVEDMLALMDYLDIPQAHLCGYSSGGAVALEALLEIPNRFIGAILAGGMSEVSDWKTKSILASARLMSAPLFIRFLNLFISLGNADMGLTFRNLFGQASHGNIDNIRQYFAYSYNYNSTERLHYIEDPLLLMCGEHDKLSQRYADIILRNVPQAKRAILKDQAHQLFTKGASATNNAIRKWMHHLESQTKDRDDISAEASANGRHAEPSEQPNMH